MLIQVSRTYSAFDKQSIKITLMFLLASIKAARFSVSIMLVMGDLPSLKSQNANSGLCLFLPIVP